MAIVSEERRLFVHLKRLAVSVAAVSLITVLAPPAAQAGEPESLAGDWIAGLELANRPAFLRVTVGSSPQKRWTATVVLQPLASISADGPSVRRVLDSWRDAPVTVENTSWTIAAGSEPDAIRLQVRAAGETSTATLTFGHHTTEVVLHHLAIVERSIELQRTGTYVLPGGLRIHIWRPSSGGPLVGGLRRADGFLTYLEENSGRSGSLYPVSGDTYIAGPTSVLPDPVRVRVVFHDEAHERRLVWQETGDKERVARLSTAYRRDEVQLKGSAGALGCDLLSPTRSGKHPAAVLVPGAGANDRYQVYMTAEVFAAHGVAALTCDKRGTGSSQGNWRLTSFEQQAEDVTTGIRFLRQRPDIDPDRVGVWGFSEGAWVAPLAATQDPHPAFLILASAPATSRRVSILNTNVDRMRQEGTSATELARYREFFEPYQQAIIDNDPTAIQRLWQRYAGAPWLPEPMPTAETLNDSWVRPRLTWSYDPVPVLSKITCPLLALWGGQDSEFPPSVHRPLLESSMRAARNRDFTAAVIPGTDHSFQWSAPSFLEQRGYSPAYLSTVVNWLATRVTNRRNAVAGLSRYRSRRRRVHARSG